MLGSQPKFVVIRETSYICEGKRPNSFKEIYDIISDAIADNQPSKAAEVPVAYEVSASQELHYHS
jgi:hypothetical protein